MALSLKLWPASVKICLISSTWVKAGPDSGHLQPGSLGAETKSSRLVSQTLFQNTEEKDWGRLCWLLVSTGIHVWAQVYTQEYIYIQRYEQTHPDVYTNILTYIQTHTHSHTLRHIYIHTRSKMQQSQVLRWGKMAWVPVFPRTALPVCISADPSYGNALHACCLAIGWRWTNPWHRWASSGLVFIWVHPAIWTALALIAHCKKLHLEEINLLL